ncbi:MAG: ATP-binding cassette domain-containing protein, partial [Anaerolineae bacterium]|nr:ATP-binding cassette domain-containing protein [Anaerolineae bacterium]
MSIADFDSGGRIIMHIINVDHVTVNHAGRVIFEDLTWAIGDRDRIGLVGPNGAGKSSLLKAIIGEVVPDTGSIVMLRGTTVGYLPQLVELPPGGTLLQAASVPPPELGAVEARLATFETQLADPLVYGDERKLARVLENQERALRDYDRLDGPRHASRVRELLAHLGFSEADYDLPTVALSGGQKKLVLLTRLAAASPSVLLLDEPDNHLDLDAKRRLEGVITNYPGAVVIVSHDRYLLDEVVTHIAELEDGRLTSYVGHYSAYAAERELRRMRQQQMYAVQQRRIQQIEEAIHEWEQKAKADLSERHARQAHSRRRMLERMEENGEMVERVVERRPMEAQFDGWRGSTKALEIIDLAMGFDDELLFLDLGFLLRHG